MTDSVMQVDENDDDGSPSLWSLFIADKRRMARDVLYSHKKLTRSFHGSDVCLFVC